MSNPWRNVFADIRITDQEDAGMYSQPCDRDCLDCRMLDVDTPAAYIVDLLFHGDNGYTRLYICARNIKYWQKLKEEM